MRCGCLSTLQETLSPWLPERRLYDTYSKKPGSFQRPIFGIMRIYLLPLENTSSSSKKPETQTMNKSSSINPPTRSYFALISDIHGNLDALGAVLADIERQPCRGILCLGDIVGYGPEPAACVERVMEACAVSVLGNHEAMLMLSDQFPLDDLRATIGEPITLAARQLSPSQMEWIQNLPISADLDPMMLVHAGLHEPGNFAYIDSIEEAEKHFAIQPTFVSFQGHTHVPVTWEEGPSGITCYKASPKSIRLDSNNRYAVNVGSVGQPRDGDPRACYALYDYQNRILRHQRVDYDVAKAMKRFKKAGLPLHNATRLQKGE
jgi:diadenosine tetraphosphatase ApaH/serine/threonine PP2A family protein phosphatase